MKLRAGFLVHTLDSSDFSGAILLCLKNVLGELCFM